MTNFASIEATLEEGRGVFDNLKNSLSGRIPDVDGLGVIAVWRSAIS